MPPLLDASGNWGHTAIDLRTRLNNKIDNLQPWSYSAFEWKQLSQQPSRFEQFGALRVSEVCPVYNCHGLTFGSRRTQVDGSTETVSMILEDDGFKEIPIVSARPGDVVIYYDVSGTILHSGIVLDLGELNVPKIWSKWGKGYEMVHLLGNCPYESSYAKFYRITTWKPEEIFKKAL